MNGGNGGVMCGDCVLSTSGGQKKRSGMHGTQSKGTGGRLRGRKKRKTMSARRVVLNVTRSRESKQSRETRAC